MLYKSGGNFQNSTLSKIEKRRYLTNCYLDRGFKVNVLNPTCHSINGGSHEIRNTDPGDNK